MKIELKKISEIANRLRQYEFDGKTRYFNIKYVSDDFDEPQLISERASSESVFMKRIDDIINNYDANKIIIEEFNQKAKSIKEPESTIEIEIEQSPKVQLINSSFPQHRPVSRQEESEQTQQQNSGKQLQGMNPLDVFGGLDGFKQEVRNEIAKEYQLLKEQDEKKQLIAENEQLKRDNKALEEDNTKLYELNEELSEKIQDLQKYIPENLKIGNLSVTKIIGSILGTATETMVKNVVLKKPEKVKDIIGEVAFEQLSGLVSGDDDEELDLTLDNPQMQAVQPIVGKQSSEVSDNPVINAINQVNLNLPPGQLAKVQIIYYHLLKDDESLDDDKLNEIVKFINENSEMKSSSGNEPED